MKLIANNYYTYLVINLTSQPLTLADNGDNSKNLSLYKRGFPDKNDDIIFQIYLG